MLDFRLSQSVQLCSKQALRGLNIYGPPNWASLRYPKLDQMLSNISYLFFHGLIQTINDPTTEPQLSYTEVILMPTMQSFWAPLGTNQVILSSSVPENSP